MSQYDVIVIGGGPAGYPCAIRAGQNKLKVACIDEWRNKDGSYAFGGTCLNAGCIPSKAMLESSELYHRAQHEFAAHGVKVGSVGLDTDVMTGLPPHALGVVGYAMVRAFDEFVARENAESPAPVANENEHSP